MEKLKEYIQQIRGVSYKPTDSLYKPQEGYVPLLRANNINKGKINFENLIYVKKDKVKESQYLKKGDILICTSSGSKELVGKAGLIMKDTNATFGAFCKVIRLKECCNNNYFNYYFQSNYYKSMIQKSSNGVNINNLKAENIDNLSVNILSYEVQENIANKLDKVQEIIDLRKKQIEVLDELIKSKFIEMFESRKYPTKRIDEVATLKSGTTFSKEYELENGELLYCKVSDMNLQGNEKYMRSSKTYVSKKVGLKSSIPANSVIFPKRGGAIGTNKKRILLNDTCVDLNTMGVTPMEDINIQYLYYYFINIDLSTLCDGSAVPQLNNKNIGPLEIAVPPIELQNKFEEIVKQIDKQKFMIEKSLKETEDLQESLMNKYFN